jgi:hypothetical protein
MKPVFRPGKLCGNNWRAESGGGRTEPHDNGTEHRLFWNGFPCRPGRSGYVREGRSGEPAGALPRVPKLP